MREGEDVVLRVSELAQPREGEDMALSVSELAQPREGEDMALSVSGLVPKKEGENVVLRVAQPREGEDMALSVSGLVPKKEGEDVVLSESELVLGSPPHSHIQCLYNHHSDHHSGLVAVVLLGNWCLVRMTARNWTVKEALYQHCRSL